MLKSTDRRFYHFDRSTLRINEHVSHRESRFWRKISKSIESKSDSPMTNHTYCDKHMIGIHSHIDAFLVDLNQFQKQSWFNGDFNLRKRDRENTDSQWILCNVWNWQASIFFLFSHWPSYFMTDRIRRFALWNANTHTHTFQGISSFSVYSHQSFAKHTTKQHCLKILPKIKAKKINECVHVL